MCSVLLFFNLCPSFYRLSFTFCVCVCVSQPHIDSFFIFGSAWVQPAWWLNHKASKGRLNVWMWTLLANVSFQVIRLILSEYCGDSVEKQFCVVGFFFHPASVRDFMEREIHLKWSNFSSVWCATSLKYSPQSDCLLHISFQFHQNRKEEMAGHALGRQGTLVALAETDVTPGCCTGSKTESTRSKTAVFLATVRCVRMTTETQRDFVSGEKCEHNHLLNQMPLTPCSLFPRPAFPGIY